MKQALRSLIFIFSAALASPAVGQQFPTVPDHSVLGRIGVGGSSGPSQAIPWSLLLANISGLQSANTVWAGPTSGPVAVPTFRLLVGADLPVPGASSLGGVQSKTCATSNWFNTLSTAGVFGCSQPAFSDISGTIAATQLPNPSATTLGGVQSKVVVSHQFLNTISTSGVPGSAQPACTDLSDATYCNTAAGQLAATATNDSAASGKVGEIIVQNTAVGSGVSLTNNTAANVATVTLTAGDWDIAAQICFNGGATTVTSALRGSISTTTGTENATSPNFAAIGYPASSAVFSTTDTCFAIAPNRQSLSGSQQFWLVGFSNFATSTLKAYGQLRARRVR